MYDGLGTESGRRVIALTCHLEAAISLHFDIQRPFLFRLEMQATKVSCTSQITLVQKA